ncbi:DEAD/DEAH box helicase [Mycobacteroides abscessus subsp. massiliense]|nr:DEAD/DEAH box helicase [Mycobacteroides abscessus subsp. massiliense]SKU02483.1 DEAD/DEAH box helicase [Mycobacteroides abscessus subsp. massiliense]
MQDLALELPTGTGKTLIGLLIAEWRRRHKRERALYVCPTRQLAHQVGAQAARYGINAKVCLKPNYDGLPHWQSSDAIAISTYSALFNYNPKFTAPQTLILDDAHAADGYVASHWTLTIDRDKLPTVYHQLVALVSPLLGAHTIGVLTSEAAPSSNDRTAVELLPLPLWWKYAEEMRDILDGALSGNDQWYAWTDTIKKGLSACNLLLSWQEITLRPLVPTTDLHPEFADAAQRVYMSATLGAGGELERIFGVRSIKRVPVPQEWEERSTGRRLFLLPSASLSPSDVDALVNDAVKLTGRALVLAPARPAVQHRQSLLEAAGVPTLTATSIEEDLDAFTGQDSAALLLANRYDGIDLPGDACRLVVLDGLPIAVNQLERFLYQNLTATGLLNERIRTRFTQGVGRATRGEGDWCAVMIATQDAYDFCIRGEFLGLLHPELQAELRFGEAQSDDRTSEDFLGLLQVLLDHDDDWNAADEQVRAIRDLSVRGLDPGAQALQAAVRNEVSFSYSMASGDYPTAVDQGIQAAEKLSGRIVDSYRAWWYYQAGTAAWMASHEFGRADMLAQAQDLFRRAAASSSTVHWFATLAYTQLGETMTSDVPAVDLKAVERIHAKLRSIGFYGTGMNKQADMLAERLGGDVHTQWEEGLKQLGNLLGFDAIHPGGVNEPDSVWVADDTLAFAWEAKIEENPDGQIGATTATQTAGHSQWVRHKKLVDETAAVPAFLISDRTRLDVGTDVHAGDTSIVSLSAIRQLATDTVAALRRVRTEGRTGDDLIVRDIIISEFSNESLLPTQLRERLSSRRLRDL